MGILKKIADFIAKASMPTYKFENNKLFFKLSNDQYYEYELNDYDIKTRHDSYINEAYTLSTNDIFMEYIKCDQNVQWKGQALSIYEGFIKEKLNINELDTLEKKEIDNYIFKLYNVDNSFVLHMIYIYSPVLNIMILDTKGDLYKNLLLKLDSKYEYKYSTYNRGDVNFNISIVKENSIRSYFGL
ncbi:hypothetical protein [Halarcobacter sp.]|uniref:hypothetical protein n=1 Tax=Halarcobacter sp. TaxID=2321133 RepID=UPI002AA678FE|nr:hypothetical protein [Halarcobacter sp.]